MRLSLLCRINVRSIVSTKGFCQPAVGFLNSWVASRFDVKTSCSVRPEIDQENMHFNKYWNFPLHFGRKML